MPTFAKEFENVRVSWHFTKGVQGKEFEMEDSSSLNPSHPVAESDSITFPKVVVPQAKELQAAFAAGQLQPKSSVYVKAVNEWHLGRWPKGNKKWSSQKLTKSYQVNPQRICCDSVVDGYSANYSQGCIGSFQYHVENLA